MTKEEKIKEVYESFGFNWNECGKYISNEGILVLPTPDLKYSLKGYEKLIEDEGKWSSFGNDGLKLQPGLLKGLFNNNGWVKIENEDDLPKDSWAYWVFRNDNLITTLRDYVADKNHLEDEINITHYQQIVKPKPPLY